MTLPWDEPPPFGDTLSTVEEAFKDGIRAFAKWYCEEWKLSREQWAKDYADPPPEGDWFAGYNAGVDAVIAAVDQFLSEVR